MLGKWTRATRPEADTFLAFYVEYAEADRLESEPSIVVLCGAPGFEDFPDEAACEGNGAVYTKTVDFPVGTEIEFSFVREAADVAPDRFHGGTETIHADMTNAAWFTFGTGTGDTQDDQQTDTGKGEPIVAIDIDLEEQNNSGITGTASLHEDQGDGSTQVFLELVGIGPGGEYPAHIHAGQCPEPGNITYPLEPVVSDPETGTDLSRTIVEAPIEEILAEPSAINIHLHSDPSVYVACGDLSQGGEIPEDEGNMGAGGMAGGAGLPMGNITVGVSLLLLSGYALLRRRQ
ncbi:MAG: hypothetical protein M3Q29_04940 [Chloroflexota bacterium]|nr:hypothetical protein [Chloroflexota bacterium]